MKITIWQAGSYIGGSCIACYLSGMLVIKCYEMDDVLWRIRYHEKVLLEIGGDGAITGSEIFSAILFENLRYAICDM